MTEQNRSGHYPVENIAASELERLRVQHQAWAADTEMMLDAIRVDPGWYCLDLGCGPFGLTRELAARVGSSGHVTGLEFSSDFVAAARSGAPANVEIIEGDAYHSGLPNDAFDLVHMRFLASTAGNPERLVAEAIRMARPGGYVACQEAAFATLRCFPPHPAWDRLTAAIPHLIPEAFGEYPAAHRIYALMRAAGMEDVHHRTAILSVPSGDPWQDYLPASAHSARSAIVGKGLFTDAELDETLTACREHLADPDTVYTSYTMIQVWGRKPS